MAPSSSPSWADAAASLREDDCSAVAELDRLATTAGYQPIIARVGKKPDNFKVEYKRTRSGEALFVLRIDGEKWSLRCKLFHLPSYCELLEELSSEVRQELLSSKECDNGAGGCKGPISFVAVGQEHSLCRHSMQFRAVSAADIPAVWRLLEAESRC